jgi:hypothetical protein
MSESSTWFKLPANFPVVEHVAGGGAFGPVRRSEIFEDSSAVCVVTEISRGDLGQIQFAIEDDTLTLLVESMGDPNIALTFKLPADIDVSAAKAEYRDEYLVFTLPRLTASAEDSTSRGLMLPSFELTSQLLARLSEADDSPAKVVELLGLSEYELSRILEAEDELSEHEIEMAKALYLAAGMNRAATFAMELSPG